ncbi:MAG: sulfotransferase [Alphaproteobacteria bacterium]|nr:sulfotransferase [Alphaproteobacteria bacterium SS10]
MNQLLAIIGTPKAGTTSLAHWLGNRPEFVLGVEKEPRFFTEFAKTKWSGPGGDAFADTLISDEQAYRANFPHLKDDQWAIDASTDYLWHEPACELLKQYGQKARVKLICLVRDPVDRAISEYNHTLREGWEPLSFADALAAEGDRMADHYHPLFYHRRRSEVAGDLARFHAAFGGDLLVLSYDQLSNPQAILDQVSGFLGLPSRPVGDATARNPSLLPRNSFVAALKSNKQLHRLVKRVLPQGLKDRLRQATHVDAREVETIPPADIAAFRTSMAAEIQHCQEAAYIPTEGWMAP